MYFSFFASPSEIVSITKTIYFCQGIAVFRYIHSHLGIFLTQPLASTSNFLGLSSLPQSCICSPGLFPCHLSYTLLQDAYQLRGFCHMNSLVKIGHSSHFFPHQISATFFLAFETFHDLAPRHLSSSILPTAQHVQPLMSSLSHSSCSLDMFL